MVSPRPILAELKRNAIAAGGICWPWCWARSRPTCCWGGAEQGAKIANGWQFGRTKGGLDGPLSTQQ